jgi:hypothetical protein
VNRSADRSAYAAARRHRNETSLPNPRVVSKAATSREVFNNSDLVLRDNVAAYRNIPRGLPRFGQIIGQASVALEEKTMPINERDQCHRHLEDAGELCDDAIECNCTIAFPPINSCLLSPA